MSDLTEAELVLVLKEAAIAAGLAYTNPESVHIREALTELVHVSEAAGESYNTTMMDAAIEAARHALQAESGSVGLDVERLARAMHAAEARSELAWEARSFEDTAPDIAAEYDRLRASASDDSTK